jgi:DNA-binding IclR family transcriptional regulator
MPRPALAATRAISVLNFLAAHPADEFTLSDLASELDINVASAHAVLGVLTDAGYLVRHPRLRTYALGPSVVALGSGALERHPAIDHARDEARRLSEELGLGVAVTALAGDDIVSLARVGEHRARDLAVRPGQRIPLVPPIGAVFVAWLDPEPWLARADDRTAMEAVLDAVRTRGWAVALESDTRRGFASALEHLPPGPTDSSRQGSVEQLMAELARTEYQVVGALDTGRTYDVVMIAAPVFGSAGEALVALTLLGLEPGLSADRVAAYGERVRDAGLVATRRSGGRPPAR